MDGFLLQECESELDCRGIRPTASIVKGSIDRQSNLIVIGRVRQHLDMVDDGGNSLDALHDSSRRILQAWAGDLADQLKFIAIELKGEVVKDAEVGEHYQFVPNFALQPLLVLNQRILSYGC